MKPYVGFRLRGSGGGGGGAATTWPVFVRNSAPFPIWVAINYRMNNQWQADGFWEVQPGARRGPIITTDNRIIYFYANGPDRRVKWSGDVLKTIRGEQYGFLQKRIDGDPGGAYTMNFTYSG